MQCHNINNNNNNDSDNLTYLYVSVKNNLIIKLIKMLNIH